MHTIGLAAAALLCIAAGPGFAAPYPPGISPETGARPGKVIGTGSSLPLSDKAGNINADTAHSAIAPRLPDPAVAPGDVPENYLGAAHYALAIGRTGGAQEALEEAESRLLDCSPIGYGNVPSRNPAVQQIQSALQAFAAGDLPHAEQQTERATTIVLQRGVSDQTPASEAPDVSLTIIDTPS